MFLDGHTISEQSDGRTLSRSRGLRWGCDEYDSTREEKGGAYPGISHVGEAVNRVSVQLVQILTGLGQTHLEDERSVSEYDEWGGGHCSVPF